MADVPLYQRPISSISIHYDNIVVIARATSKIYSEKCKHIRLRQNVVRQLISDGVISLEFLRSKMNLLGIFVLSMSIPKQV